MGNSKRITQEKFVLVSYDETDSTSNNMNVRYRLGKTSQDLIQGDEDVLREYQLPPEQLGIIADTIYKKLTFNRKPSDRPFAVICLGQPGAGKSGLMAYTAAQFKNAILVDIDEFRAFYPKYEQLGIEHPELFEKVTGDFATSMILLLTPVLTENKHSLILHKTRGDEQIIVDTIDPLKKEGYDIVLRTLSVHEIDSKLSSLERSLEKRERTGYCRWVEKPYHDKHYKGVVNLTDKLESEGLADVVQVFERGPVPAKPVLIYSKTINEHAKTNPAFVEQGGKSQIEQYNTKKYENAKQAIIRSREAQLSKAMQSLPARLDDIKQRAVEGERENEFISELEEMYIIYSSNLS